MYETPKVDLRPTFGVHIFLKFIVHTHQKINTANKPNKNNGML